MINTHNTNNIRQSGRIRNAYNIAGFTSQIVTCTVITCGCNENARVVCVFKCFFNCDRDVRAAEGHIDNRCAIHVSVLNGFGNIRVVEVTRRITCFQDHNFTVVSNTNTALLIVFSGDDTCNMCAVTVIVHGIFVITNTVPTINVIDIAVAVIVSAVIRNLGRVHPNIITEVNVVIIYARINNCNNYIRATAGILALFL